MVFILLTMVVLFYMSHTIDDFSNFFREDKEKQKFNITAALNSVLSLTSPSLDNQHIQIEIESDNEITAFGYQNEYAQVNLNIIK